MDSSLAFIPSLEASQKSLSMLSGKACKVDTLKLLSVLVPKKAYGAQRISAPFYIGQNVPCVSLTANRSELVLLELTYSSTLFAPTRSDTCQMHTTSTAPQAW